MYIAICLSNKRIKASDAYKIFNSEVIHYTNIHPDIVITHCTGQHQYVKCIPFHPISITSFILYILKIYSFLIPRIHKLKGIIVWGSLIGVFFLPLKILQKKLVIVQLGDWPNVIYWKVYYRYGAKISKIIKTISVFLEKMTFLLSDTIITNSPSVLKKYRFIKMKLILPPLKEILYYSKNCEATLQGRDLCIVSIVRLDYEKGIYRLIKAFINAMKHSSPYKCKLYIIGSGPLGTKLKEFCTKRFLNCIDHMPRQLLFQHIYKHTFALILPSHTEGFPLVLVEALFCKVPLIVISSELDSALTRYATYIFNDENELSKIIEILITKFEHDRAL